MRQWGFNIRVILHRETSDIVKVYIADNGKGMELDTLKRALILGESATKDSRLNEHGFGLKNALATLSSATNKWKLWTRDPNTKKVSSVESPFSSNMEVEDDDSFPNTTYLPADMSTLIEVDVKMSFMQTVQGRGAKTTDLIKIREWLIEHLGVFYRGYLAQDETTMENEGSISVSIDNDTLKVPVIDVPIGDRKTAYINVEIGGTTHQLTYNYGSLDDQKRDRIVRGQKAKYYYQGNQRTQGIDIRLGKRVIAVQQLEHIWTNDANQPITRHNNYNDFVGELLIPEMPRGILTTVNNKTDFNLDDSDWSKIFEQLEEYKPVANIRETSESDIKRKWMQMLKATNPEDEVTDELHVWPPGVRIDVFRKTIDGNIIIYEIKVGSAAPIHLYQLKMYWDGLILNGKQPKEAILLVEDFQTNIELMANEMNKLTPPQQSLPYNFRIEKMSDKGLLDHSIKNKKKRR